MNRRITPILLAIVVLLALLAYISERPSHAKTAKSGNEKTAGEGRADADKQASGARLFEIDQSDIQQVRVKKDYWNTYALQRGSDGSWKLVEPSAEPVAAAAVNTLLSTIETLPVLSVIDMLSDDSERYRQYGLWEPAVEVTISDNKEAHTLRVGSPTTDGKGVYCVVVGRNKVYVTTPEAVRILSADLSVYRQEVPKQANP
jgi:Domain of unknown function (DUF4340)